MRLGNFAVAAALLAGVAGSAQSQAKPTTHGEWVRFKSGADSIRAYVAYPERSSKAPGIIVIHEIYGLTDWEPTVADRLAKEGYVAIVPDLLSSKHGRTPKDEVEARQLMGELEDKRVTVDLDATYRYLNNLLAVDKGKIGT
nr:dienelactone hydrolase family protein [Gemmatimonadales bacterium]